VDISDSESSNSCSLNHGEQINVDDQGIDLEETDRREQGDKYEFEVGAPVEEREWQIVDGIIQAAWTVTNLQKGLRPLQLNRMLLGPYKS